MASQILFTAGHCLLVYIKSILVMDPIHTSGLMEASASTVYRPPSSGCGGVCVIGAWPDAVLVADGSPAVWFPQCPTPWVAWFDSQGRQLLAGQRISATACLGERRGAAMGRRFQASLLQRPLPLYRDQSLNA